ncbi:hypothetical protein SAMN05216349_14613, partial [Oribacterium sp. KHPX15]|uniref:tetratricopeptide repeat protein n=1 Tax=Oribacterium sp. KHPX15 TaxID=1855342 RepID=UPI0008999357
MTAKEQKLYSFYSQCIAKGYTDMADDTQSLKAKVIASDLDLKYGKIAVLYVEAKKVFELEEARRKVEAEQAAQEAIRTSVLGELVLTLREDPNNNRGRIDVYRRPDGSVYCTHNREETKFEGTPDIQVNKGGVLSYTYHPSRTIFTGASSGGISMGGFHQTKAYTTEKVSDTGKGDIYAKSGDMNIWVKYIDFSDATDHAFRRDETYKSLSQGKRIICFNSSNASFSRDMIGMAMKSGAGYQDVLSKASLANDMMKLSMGEIQRIAAFLNEVISGNYPETDEEYYTKAVRLSDSTKSDDLMKAAQIFRKIIDYKDSSSRVDSIQKKYEEVLQEEKENRILQKERVDRKRKKALSIIAVLAIIGLVTALVVTKVIIPNEHYKNAVALKNAGNYEEAINAFSVLNHYKDSEEQIKECKYYYAISLKDSGSFEEAITAFKQLNGYNDSAEQISSCEICIKDKNYKAAVALKDAGSYAEAITAFEQLNGYRDSVEQINSCKICIQDENYKKA